MRKRSGRIDDAAASRATAEMALSLGDPPAESREPRGETEDDQTEAASLAGGRLGRELVGELGSQPGLDGFHFVLRFLEPEPGGLAVEFNGRDLVAGAKGVGDGVHLGVGERGGGHGS